MGYLGFTCLKNAICSLNVVYMMVGFLLMGVAVWGKSYGIVSSIHVIGGVIAVGFFLLLISIMGLYGAIKHHQVLLFFYMAILLLLFLIQFGMSCACLALRREQQENLLRASWGLMANDTRISLERHLNCCGLLNTTEDMEDFKKDVQLCNAACKDTKKCFTCGDVMLKRAGEALKILGGIGLFFSFTEILGAWLVMRFRNLKDPRANPSAFL
ncbi:tetraspanin-31-like [Chanos chanos]|uniref:Tetraspanin-31-like n=1 Tax=Chanos chanos TaxID=29144 RepID=A0A6J2VQW4_CHACN|nr:tetraspanin-31 [Chanos chanos]